MSMRFIIIIFLGLLFLQPTISVAQINAVEGYGQLLDIRLFSDQNSYESDYKGTPYIYENFVEAKINDFKQTFDVRYNAEKDEFQVKTTDDKIIVLNQFQKNYSIKILDENKKYETVRYENGDVGYAVLLWQNNDNVSLYKRERIVYSPPKEAENSYEQSKKAEFERTKDLFYYSTSDKNIVIEVPTRKNKIDDLFVGSKKYIKQNDIELDTKEGMIAVFEKFSNML